MQIVRRIRASRTAPAIAARAAEYASRGMVPSGAVESFQLDVLNRLWHSYARHIPFYRDLQESGRSPRRFASLAEFAASVPITEKSLVRERAEDLRDPTRVQDHYRITGGSTGEPTKMPSWSEEHADSLIDKWVARSWYGVTPADALFTIWGHSHLLGKGLKGKINARLRQLKDQAIGTYRFSAYDLGVEATRHAAAVLLARKPAYFITYSSALEHFARVNEGRAADLGRLKLKVAIATGEVFPTAEGPAIASRVLGCPVAMEYGSVETDILAHTHPALPSADGSSLPGFAVFWQRYLLESVTLAPGGEPELLVTSLYPRCFPLVRYRIGDSMVLYPGDPPLPVTRAAAVVGRTNSFVALSDGTRVHTMGIKHCVEGLGNVSRFQVVTQAGRAGLVELRVMLAGAGGPGDASPGGLAARAAADGAIREKARKVHAELAAIPINFEDAPIQSRAGKTPMVAELPA